MIDLVIILGIQTILWAVLSFLMEFSFDTFYALYLLASFILYLGYFMLLEWSWNGQTIGKRIVGIRVADVQVRKLSGAQVILRTLFRVIDMFPYFYFTGALVSIFSKKYQRLGDHMAGTMVVSIARVSQPPLQDLPDVKFNSFRKHPRFEAHLRREISPQEGECIVQALLRRKELDTDARLTLYHDLAESLQSRLRIPPDLEGLGDETFLRNCVDTLYRDMKIL